MGLLSMFGGIAKKGASALGNIAKGGGTFKNPIISIAGQKERIGNVVNVVKSAVTLKGVTVNRNIIKNETVAKVLEKAAGNPYATAAVATVGVMAAKRIIPAASKFIRPKSALVAGTATAGGGIITQQKAPQLLKEAIEKEKASDQLTNVAQEAIIMNKDIPAATVAAKSLLGGTKKTHGRRKSVRKKKRKASKRRTKVRNKRKLKFGSKAFRERYLTGRKRKKRSGKKRSKRRSGKFVSFRTKSGKLVKFKAKK